MKTENFQNFRTPKYLTKYHYYANSADQDHIWTATDAQSGLGIHCQLTESLDTTEGINREQMHAWDFGHAWDDLNLLVLCLFKGKFSLDTVE